MNWNQVGQTWDQIKWQMREKFDRFAIGHSNIIGGKQSGWINLGQEPRRYVPLPAPREFGIVRKDCRCTSGNRSPNKKSR